MYKDITININIKNELDSLDFSLSKEKNKN